MEISTTRRESESINKQKQEESKSLDNALRNISRSQHPILYELMNGTTVEHNYKRPDFIRQVVDSDILIGIEHFSVSFKAIRKNSGEIMSISEIKKHNWEDMKQDVQNKNWLWKVPCAVLATIKHLCNMGILRYAIPCALEESFQYSLNKHLEKVDKYKENLHSISPSADKKIIFLIDVYLDNPELYIFRPQNYERPQKIKSYEKAIDSSLITVLQSNLRALSNVDWLIFNMYADEAAAPATLCLQTNKDILMQLHDLNCTIYRYIGDDCCDCPDAARAVVLKNIENHNLQDVTPQANMFSDVLSIIGAPRQRQREQWAMEKCLEYEQQDVTYACTHLFSRILKQYKQKLKKETHKGLH